MDISVKKYSARIVQIKALQLVVVENPREDNAKEVADWCGGNAVWNYNSETKVLNVAVHGLKATVKPTDWVVQYPINNIFEVLRDDEFRNIYDTGAFDAPFTCAFCLSDPKFTPQGDPDDKTCPICQARYSGPARTKEYNILVAAGLAVKEE